MQKEVDRKNLAIGIGVFVVLIAGILILNNLETIESPTGEVVKEIPKTYFISCAGEEPTLDNLQKMAVNNPDATSGELIKKWRACSR